MPEAEPLRYWIEIGGQSYPAREVRGYESLSAPFHLEVRFALEEGRDLDPEALVEEPVAVRLERGTRSRTLRGLGTEVRVGATQSGAPEVLVVVEPRLALARLRQDLRIFRDRTIPQIVAEVLAGHGIEQEWRLADRYEPLPYTVQFRETDFAFVSRLLEDEGIFYAFGEDGVLCLGDSSAAYDALPGEGELPFRPPSALDRQRDCVNEFGQRARLLPGQLTLRDFNPDHPTLDLTVGAAGPTAGGPEHYDYPGEYDTPAGGRRKVGLAAAALACAAGPFVGRATAAALRPGVAFALVDVPPGVDEGRYVATRLEHDFAVDRAGFSLVFEALAGDVAFRPPRVTPAPVLPNPMIGFVTGPPGEDIHTDEWGRVKVHFPWDRLQPADESCSHWIPVLQDNTGHSCSIPRIGWEVLVHFLEGDPDRPVVVGRLYNPLDPPHTPLPDNKTRSFIKSLSSPRERERDHSGTNEITLEDCAGREFLQFHAQKDQNVVIANDKTETVLVNSSLRVERDEAVDIGNDQRITVGADLRPSVDHDQSWTVGGHRDLTVGGGAQVTVTGNRTLSIGGMHQRRLGVADNASAEQGLTERVGGVILETSLGTNSCSSSKATALVVGGAHVEIAKQDKSETSGKARAELVGGALFTRAGGEIAVRANRLRATTVGGLAKLSAQKTMAIVGNERLAMTATAASFAGPKAVTLKVGEATVVLKEDAIVLHAPSEIRLTVTGANQQAVTKAAKP